MEKYYNALNAIYQGNYSKLQKTWERFNDWQKAFENEKSSFDLEGESAKLENKNIKLFLKEDSLYPSLLKEMPFPPFGIYVLGNIAYEQPAIAIVGTRTATEQGKELAEVFAEKLSRGGVTVISGLALGIDEAAHRGALKGGGKTIAVLGTPLSRIYPKNNERLAKDILKSGGAIISEFPLNQEYYPQNFLIRNRIISGLANAILVIEAPEKSGSLATARFALEQNRDVFVIPGNVGARNYKGSNALIKAGAAPVTGPEDIFDYFGIDVETIKVSSPIADGEEGRILKIIKNGKEKLTVGQLLLETKMNLSSLNKNLAMLIIKGIIRESNGKYYLN